MSDDFLPKFRRAVADYRRCHREFMGAAAAFERIAPMLRPLEVRPDAMALARTQRELAAAFEAIVDAMETAVEAEA